MYNLSTENYINYSPEICGASWSLEKSVCLCESVATRMETLCIRTTDLSQWFVPFYLLSIAILFWDTYFLQLTTADSCLWWKKTCRLSLSWSTDVPGNHEVVPMGGGKWSKSKGCSCSFARFTSYVEMCLWSWWSMKQRMQPCWSCIWRLMVMEI